MFIFVTSFSCFANTTLFMFITSHPIKCFNIPASQHAKWFTFIFSSSKMALQYSHRTMHSGSQSLHKFTFLFHNPYYCISIVKQILFTISASHSSLSFSELHSCTSTKIQVLSTSTYSQFQCELFVFFFLPALTPTSIAAHLRAAFPASLS